MLIINYVFNQAFSYFQFTQKTYLLPQSTPFRSHYRSFAHLYHTANSQTAAILFIPYVLWSFSRLISRLRFTG
ncbi:hypothetical protein PO124_19800 [Bacillus licheniformis]|nr:hypothetical protein [Bacillus licheniformis]